MESRTLAVFVFVGVVVAGFWGFVVFCFVCFGAAGDGDGGVLGGLLAVLGFEEGGHVEVLAAEVVVILGGDVGRELAVGAGGDVDFDGFEGVVGDVRLRRSDRAIREGQ